MHRTLPTLLALTLTALHLGQTTGQEPVQAPATQETAAQETAAQDTATQDTAAQETAAQRLQGRWEVVRGVNQGKELTAAQLQDTYVTIATNTIVTYDRDQNERFKAVFTIDESKRPMEINMRTVLPNAPTRPAPDAAAKAGPSPDSAGILKIVDRQRWILCYALPGAERPKKFASPVGSQTMLFTLEKQQDKKPQEATASKKEGGA